MRSVFKFLLLVVLLNVVRYGAGYPLEALVIYRPLSAAMAESRPYFNTSFTTFDWATSYFYNFMMWLTCEWVFYLMHPVLRGGMLLRSLKVYGLMFLFFASLSAIYMNHYSHPKTFYLWNIADAAIVFALVAVANGLLFPRFFPATSPHEPR